MRSSASCDCGWALSGHNAHVSNQDIEKAEALFNSLREPDLVQVARPAPVRRKRFRDLSALNRDAAPAPAPRVPARTPVPSPPFSARALRAPRRVPPTLPAAAPPPAEVAPHPVVVAPRPVVGPQDSTWKVVVAAGPRLLTFVVRAADVAAAAVHASRRIEERMSGGGFSGWRLRGIERLPRLLG